MTKPLEYAIQTKFLQEKMQQMELTRKTQDEVAVKQQGKTLEVLREEHAQKLKDFVLAVFIRCVRAERSLSHRSNLKDKTESLQQLARHFYRCAHFI